MNKILIMAVMLGMSGAAYAANSALDQAVDPALWKGAAPETVSLPKLEITIPNRANKPAEFTAPTPKPAPAVVPPLKAALPAPAKPEARAGLLGNLTPAKLLTGIGAVNLLCIICTGAVPLVMGVATLLGIAWLCIKK